MNLLVEDGYGDVLSKAQKGLGLSTERLAELSGVSESLIRAARRGEFDENVARALGSALGLKADALLCLGRGEWGPREASDFEGFVMIRSPFYEWEVNAFVVWDVESKRAIAFDTGSTAEPMIEFLEERSLSLEAVIVTHAHWDHFDGAPALKERWPEAAVFLGTKEAAISVEAQRVEEGFRYELGKLSVRGFDTPGHTAGGMSFVVGGLPQRLAVVGDALFAGSMGGANVSYSSALDSMARILGLDERTLLAPGHGPLTTVKEEREMNCFARGC